MESTVLRCRICKGVLTEYLNLGNHAPSDAFLDREQFAHERTYPLSVAFCEDCSLSQLTHTIPCTELYNDLYPYETRMNSQGIRHFRELAYDANNRFLIPEDLVVDIGSNDGTLLEHFKRFGSIVCGVEPVHPIAEKAGVETISGFFDSDAVAEILSRYGKAEVVTATNVFAHIDDIHGVVRNVKRLLSPTGVFIIEAPYHMSLIDKLAFDTIYHEHLSYLSFTPLHRLFSEHGMEIFDGEWYPVHGGTMRYYVSRMDRFQRSTMVDDYTITEKSYDFQRMLKFGTRVKDFRYSFVRELEYLKGMGKSIVGVSAPAKGNTLINYCKIDSTILDYITERSEKKIGKYTPGSHIEVVPDSRLIEDQPDYAIILAWNWESQIKNSLKEYKGEWILPHEKGLKDLCFRTSGVSRFSDSSTITEARL